MSEILPSREFEKYPWFNGLQILVIEFVNQLSVLKWSSYNNAMSTELKSRV